jgi:hypothetical protein
VPPGDIDRVERMVLLHLLEHHGGQVRFEASPWVTEFGIVRQLSSEPPDALKRALRALELTRMVYRRTQYVVGYSEPKQVFSLTPTGHRKALEIREPGGDSTGVGGTDGPPSTPRIDPANGSSGESGEPMV